MIKTEIYYVVQFYNVEDLEDTFFNPHHVVAGPFFDIIAALDAKRECEGKCIKPDFRIATQVIDLELV